jgi:hypothetical protein
VLAVFVIAPPVVAMLRLLIVLVAGPVNPAVEATNPVAATVVTPVSAPAFNVTDPIVLAPALIPPDVASVVPLNVNVPAVAPFIVD